MKKILAAIAALVIVILCLGLYNEYSVEQMGAAYNADMTILRTPDERFDALTDFPYPPHYLEISDPDLGPLRVHYLDEGPRDGELIVLVHGQATWAYSFRNMIPLLTAAGFRVIVPDLVGFGRSDKPGEWEEHTFQKHVDWLTATLQGLNVSNANAFLFDWGGYFGLRVMAEHPEIFSRVVLCTTTLPRGQGLLNAAWVAWWRRHILKPPVFPMGQMVQDMTDSNMNAQTIAGLDAPYPDESYKAGPRRFPMLIPATFLNPASGPNRAAWDTLSTWDKPTLTLVSERLAKRGFNPREFHDHMPGTRNQPHAVYPDTGFFLIEDAPAALAEKTIEFIRLNPSPES